MTCPRPGQVPHAWSTWRSAPRPAIHFRQKWVGSATGAVIHGLLLSKRFRRRFAKERPVFARKSAELPKATPRGEFGHCSRSRSALAERSAEKMHSADM